MFTQQQIKKNTPVVIHKLDGREIILIRKGHRGYYGSYWNGEHYAHDWFLEEELEVNK